MSRFRSSGATNNDISLSNGSWNRILPVNHVSASLEDVEHFFDRVVVVVWERSFSRRDTNDRHSELLGAESSRDVPTFSAEARRHGGERSEICLGDVEDRWVWLSHCEKCEKSGVKSQRTSCMKKTR